MISRAKNQGFSLVELLIGITIGLFLLAGLLTFFGQNRAAYSYQQSQSGQQDSERLANIMFTNVLQQAGFSEMTNQRILNRASLFPAGGPFADGQTVVGTEATATVSLIGGGTQTVANDSIAIRFWDGTGIIDCIGNPAPVGAMSVVLLSADGVNLNCSTDGGAAQPLVGDDQGPVAQQIRILGMAVAYGLDTNADESIDTFQRASGVGDWNQVRVAEIQLIIQSGTRPPESLSFAVALENMRGVG
ncbi:MAG: prepilin-type N-terminal cleavage/methylation domain-containing protein [Woeseiaceae bacterium]